METPPEVFPPDDLPRPSRPKAGLGLVIMMMVMMLTIMMTIAVLSGLFWVKVSSLSAGVDSD